MTAQDICRRLEALGNRERARVSRRFFKTGPGEYGEGDIFVGIAVPEIRRLAKEYRWTPLRETGRLLQSPVHEARLLALVMLSRLYARGNASERERIYNLYLANTRFVNNWDLVDVSAEHIVGAYLKDRNREPLYVLAASHTLWERRVAIMATFHYVKHGEFGETFRIARMLLHDPHDLIHKAVGWMLRETGKRDRPAEGAYLRTHYKEMPRTMLRYAIERFPAEVRQQYLRGEL